MQPESNPHTSVIMVDGSFREQFHLLDYLSDQSLPSDEFEVIWVEYYDQLKAELDEKICTKKNFQALMLNRQGVYHSSYCFNAGILASRGDLIVIPDADLVVEKDFLETIWGEHQTYEKLVMYIHRLDESQKNHRDDFDLDHLRSSCKLLNPANYGGCLTVRKKWLIKINGYEQHPIFGTGMHANGMDVYTRFKNAGIPIMWHPSLKLYHPWHPLTRTWSYSYKLQKTVIHHRSLTKECLPFQGLDSSLDRSVPAELERKICDVRRSSHSLIHRLYSGLKKLVGYVCN